MSRHSSSVDRAVRIELLRARAAIERESLVQNTAQVGRALTPASLLREAVPGLSGGGTPKLLWQIVGLARRYPYVGSSLSALLMGGGKRAGLLKLLTGGMVGWQLWKAWQSYHDSRSGR